MTKNIKKNVPEKAVRGTKSVSQKWKEPLFPAGDVVDHVPLSWRFSHCDHEGPYSWSELAADETCDVLRKLPEFERMNWDALNAAGCHPIAVPDLCKDAKDRLAALQHDDIDELMSFRITGAKRVWCVREGGLMRVLWWDPNHQVYPTEKDKADRLKRKNRSK